MTVCGVNIFNQTAIKYFSSVSREDTILCRMLFEWFSSIFRKHFDWCKIGRTNTTHGNKILGKDHEPRIMRGNMRL